MKTESGVTKLQHVKVRLNMTSENKKVMLSGKGGLKEREK